MSKVNDNGYFTVQAFMVKDLGLKGNDLLIYAIIYGFSQAEEQKYTGSLQYLADWTNSTKRGVMKSLKELVEQGLIHKDTVTINGVKFVSYAVNKVHPYGTKFTPMEQSLPNNIDIHSINTDINMYNSVDMYKRKKEIRKKENFVAPTFEEVKAYCEERNSSVNPKYFYDYFTASEWVDSEGKPVRNWKQKLITWEKRENERKPNNGNASKPATQWNIHYDNE